MVPPLLLPIFHYLAASKAEKVNMFSNGAGKVLMLHLLTLLLLKVNIRVATTSDPHHDWCGINLPSISGVVDVTLFHGGRHHMLGEVKADSATGTTQVLGAMQAVATNTGEWPYRKHIFVILAPVPSAFILQGSLWNILVPHQLDTRVKLNIFQYFSTSLERFLDHVGTLVTASMIESGMEQLSVTETSPDVGNSKPPSLLSQLEERLVAVIEEKMEKVEEKIEEKIEEKMEKVEEKIEEKMEKVEEKMEKVEEKMEERRIL